MPNHERIFLGLKYMLSAFLTLAVQERKRATQRASPLDPLFERLARRFDLVRSVFTLRAHAGVWKQTRMMFQD